MDTDREARKPRGKKEPERKFEPVTEAEKAIHEAETESARELYFKNREKKHQENLKKIEELFKERAGLGTKSPEEEENERLKKEIKKRLIEKENEEYRKTLTPKPKTDLEKEEEAYKKELDRLNKIHTVEELKNKVKEAKERVANKSKYLKGEVDKKGGWFSFFKSDTSKNMTIAATLGLGLICCPFLFVGGMMFLMDSDEKKEKAKKAA